MFHNRVKNYNNVQEIEIIFTISAYLSSVLDRNCKYNSISYKKLGKEIFNILNYIKFYTISMFLNAILF